MGSHENPVKDYIQCKLVLQLLEDMQKESFLTEGELETARRLTYEKYGFDDADDFAWGSLTKSDQDKIWTPAPENLKIIPGSTTDELLSSSPPFYVSLTEFAKQCDEGQAAYVIHSWMRSGNTLEFLSLWEKKHNPNFNEDGYQSLMQKRQSNNSSITPAQWIKEVNAIGIISKRGNNGGTSAHPIIACDFMMWLSAEFKMHLLETMHVLKRL